MAEGVDLDRFGEAVVSPGQQLWDEWGWVFDQGDVAELVGSVVDVLSLTSPVSDPLVLSR